MAIASYLPFKHNNNKLTRYQTLVYNNSSACISASTTFVCKNFSSTFITTTASSPSPSATPTLPPFHSFSHLQNKTNMSELAPQTQRYRIGYALEPKKIQNLLRTSLVDHAKDRGVDLIPIDPTKPLIQQGTFHCIIHKLQPKDWNKLHLEEYVAKHPHGVTIVDPPELVKKLQNRVSMLDSVSQLQISLENFAIGVPNQVVVDQTNNEEDNKIEEMGLDVMSFPVIAKPLYADGTASSHELCLVFDREGLRTTLNKNIPMVLQEFVNHGGVVFKVYVAGEHVKCVKRRSLPDISEDKAKTLKGTLKFSQISNLTVQENGTKTNGVHGGGDGDGDGDGADLSNIEKAEMPPESLIRELARALREVTGLNLFNVDVIRDAKDCKRYLVIDINYFPGYAKLPSYESFITDFLLDSVRNKTAKVGENEMV